MSVEEFKDFRGRGLERSSIRSGELLAHGWGGRQNERMIWRRCLLIGLAVATWGPRSAVAQSDMGPIERRAAALIERASGPIRLDPEVFPNPDPPDIETAGRVVQALEQRLFDLSTISAALARDMESIVRRVPSTEGRLLVTRIDIMRALHVARQRALDVFPSALPDEFRRAFDARLRLEQRILQCSAVRYAERLSALRGPVPASDWLTNAVTERCRAEAR